jgi:uncharacterized protein (DUF1697 family)
VAVFVALLRAVNVGGTGMLPMKDLSALCLNLGFKNVRTYIQSGNVVFESPLAEAKIHATLEQALEKRMGKKIDVILRSAAELRSILQANPFPDVEPAKVAVVFLSEAPPKLETIAGPDGEQVRAAKREIYIHYPNGMGRSKLKLPPSVRSGTVRNINTVSKLAGMAAPA